MARRRKSASRLPARRARQGREWALAAILCLASVVPAPRDAEAGSLDSALVTDSDGDGVTDWDEWRAGTDPADPSSCFRITSLANQDGLAILSWNSTSGSVYEVVSSPSVSGLAADEAERIALVATTGGTPPRHVSISVVTNAPAAGSRFFSVRLFTPPTFEKESIDLATFE